MRILPTATAWAPAKMLKKEMPGNQMSTKVKQMTKMRTLMKMHRMTMTKTSPIMKRMTMKMKLRKGMKGNLP